MPRAFTASRKSVSFVGTPIPGATDRQKLIAGFDQDLYSQAHVLCVGAGGLISHIAPTLVRKGIGQITLVDADVVEASNLNRQHFYSRDITRNKAAALARNLKTECIAATVIRGWPMRIQEAIAAKRDLAADVVICGVDNNPARTAVSRYFRRTGVPVIFSAVSRDADHGYVFIQETEGSCLGCLFPDIADDHRYPCPGTPAVADILQAVGALSVYAVDSLLMQRRRTWNYRRVGLSDGAVDGLALVPRRPACRICTPVDPRDENERASGLALPL